MLASAQQWWQSRHDSLLNATSIGRSPRGLAVLRPAEEEMIKTELGIKDSKRMLPWLVVEFGSSNVLSETFSETSDTTKRDRQPSRASKHLDPRETEEASPGKLSTVALIGL